MLVVVVVTVFVAFIVFGINPLPHTHHIGNLFMDRQTGGLSNRAVYRVTQQKRIGKLVLTAFFKLVHNCFIDDGTACLFQPTREGTQVFFLIPKQKFM